jgi:hypothetical protein
VRAGGRARTGKGYDTRGGAAVIDGRVPALDVLSGWARQVLA